VYIPREEETDSLPVVPPVTVPPIESLQIEVPLPMNSLQDSLVNQP